MMIYTIGDYMKLSRHIKNIRKKGLSRIVFIAFAAMIIIITIIFAFK